jgi:hypothetical protein
MRTDLESASFGNCRGCVVTILSADLVCEGLSDFESAGLLVPLRMRQWWCHGVLRSLQDVSTLCWNRNMSVKLASHRPIPDAQILACSLSSQNVHSWSKRVSCWYISTLSSIITRNDAFDTAPHTSRYRNGTSSAASSVASKVVKRGRSEVGGVNYGEARRDVGQTTSFTAHSHTSRADPLYPADELIASSSVRIHATLWTCRTPPDRALLAIGCISPG